MKGILERTRLWLIQKLGGVDRTKAILPHEWRSPQVRYARPIKLGCELRLGSRAFCSPEEHMRCKTWMVHRLAREMERSGAVMFETIQDGQSGGVTLRASVLVVPQD